MSVARVIPPIFEGGESNGRRGLRGGRSELLPRTEVGQRIDEVGRVETDSSSSDVTPAPSHCSRYRSLPTWNEVDDVDIALADEPVAGRIVGSGPPRAMLRGYLKCIDAAMVAACATPSSNDVASGALNQMATKPASSTSTR